jgi:hypothetical protein
MTTRTPATITEQLHAHSALLRRAQRIERQPLPFRRRRSHTLYNASHALAGNISADIHRALDTGLGTSRYTDSQLSALTALVNDLHHITHNPDDIHTATAYLANVATNSIGRAAAVFRFRTRMLNNGNTPSLSDVPPVTNPDDIITLLTYWPLPTHHPHIAERCLERGNRLHYTRGRRPLVTGRPFTPAEHDKLHHTIADNLRQLEHNHGLASLHIAAQLADDNTGNDISWDDLIGTALALTAAPAPPHGNRRPHTGPTMNNHPGHTPHVPAPLTLTRDQYDPCAPTLNRLGGRYTPGGPWGTRWGENRYGSGWATGALTHFSEQHDIRDNGTLSPCLTGHCDHHWAADQIVSWITGTNVQLPRPGRHPDTIYDTYFRPLHIFAGDPTADTRDLGLTAAYGAQAPQVTFTAEPWAGTYLITCDLHHHHNLAPGVNPVRTFIYIGGSDRWELLHAHTTRWRLHPHPDERNNLDDIRHWYEQPIVTWAFTHDDTDIRTAVQLAGEHPDITIGDICRTVDALHH